MTPLGASAWPCAESVGEAGALTRARARTHGHPMGHVHAALIRVARTRVHTTSARQCNVLPSLCAVADAGQPSYDGVCRSCAWPGPLQDAHVHGGGSARRAHSHSRAAGLPALLPPVTLTPCTVQARRQSLLVDRPEVRDTAAHGGPRGDSAPRLASPTPTPFVPRLASPRPRPRPRPCPCLRPQTAESAEATAFQRASEHGEHDSLQAEVGRGSVGQAVRAVARWSRVETHRALDSGFREWI